MYVSIRSKEYIKATRECRLLFDLSRVSRVKITHVYQRSCEQQTDGGQCDDRNTVWASWTKWQQFTQIDAVVACVQMKVL